MAMAEPQYARLQPVGVLPILTKAVDDYEYRGVRKGLRDVHEEAGLLDAGAVEFEPELVDGLVIARPSEETGRSGGEFVKSITRDGDSLRLLFPDASLEQLQLELDGPAAVLAYAGDGVIAFETLQSRTVPLPER